MELAYGFSLDICLVYFSVKQSLVSLTVIYEVSGSGEPYQNSCSKVYSIYSLESTVL